MDNIATATRMFDYGGNRFRYISPVELLPGQLVECGSNKQGIIYREIKLVEESRPDKGRWAKPTLTNTVVLDTTIHQNIKQS